MEARREGSRRGEAPCHDPSPHLLFTCSSFRILDYLGAWNRLNFSMINKHKITNGNYRVSSSENVQVQVEFLGKQVHRQRICQKSFPLY